MRMRMGSFKIYLYENIREVLEVKINDGKIDSPLQQISTHEYLRNRSDTWSRGRPTHFCVMGTGKATHVVLFPKNDMARDVVVTYVPAEKVV